MIKIVLLLLSNLVLNSYLLGQNQSLSRILSYIIGTKKNIGLPKSYKGIARERKTSLRVTEC